MPGANGSFWTEFVAWIVRHNLGDLASVAGVIIVIVGFGFTLMNVYRSKAAATRAEEAAKETRESIRLFDTVSDFANSISTMDEIKRLHRESAWAILPDRYASLRKLLVTLRSANPGLSENHATTIQRAIQNLNGDQN